MIKLFRPSIAAIALATALIAAACSTASAPNESLTIYSGRNKELVGPLLDRFAEQTGIDVSVRYGGSAELAALLVKEGSDTPADIFLAQDAGAVGSVALEGLFGELPESVVSRVDARFVGPESSWTGVTGRARVIVYNTDALSEADVPTSVFELTDEKWRGRVGIAPQNASFQAFVSAMRLETGDDRTREWLEAMKANDARIYPNNLTIVDGTVKGEVEAGLVNSYYLPRVEAEAGDVPAENLFLEAGDPGALVNVSAAGILADATNKDAAQQLLEFLLSTAGQEYFVEETFEYALAEGVPPPEGNPPLREVEGTDVDLTKLGDELPSTIEMLEAVGLL